MRTNIFSALLWLVLVRPSSLRRFKSNINLMPLLPAASKPISDTLFGIFFEDINHAGVDGLWAELVMNRASPGKIDPWGGIGDNNSIHVETGLSSPFERNKVATRMHALCVRDACPSGAVGIYNPGFGGMNIEQGKEYKFILYAHGSGPFNLAVAFKGMDGKRVLGTAVLSAKCGNTTSWTKMEVNLVATNTDRHASLWITPDKKVTVWLDQI